MTNAECTLPPATSSREKYARGRRANRWAERTVSELAQVSREIATQERWARQAGILQRRDARVKWIALLLLLIAGALLHHLIPLTIAVFLPPMLAALSGIPPLLLVRRGVRVALPFLLIGVLVAFGTVHGKNGIESATVLATRLVLRMGFSLLLTLLLVLTTRFRDLMTGLRGLGIPGIFVSVLERTYQHLFHLPLIAMEMFQARRARTVGVARAQEARRFVGFSLGALLGKTHALAESTHAAMLARGYGGEWLKTKRHPITAADMLFLVTALLLSAALLFLDTIPYGF